MDKQAREAREQTKALSGKAKWENFWFYYKKHVLIGIFTIVVVVFSVVQCSTRTDYDLSVSFYSSIGTSSDGINQLEEIMKAVIDDTNNNKKIDIGIALYSANFKEIDDVEQMQAVQAKLMVEMAAGEAMGYIFDETYKQMALNQYADMGDTILEISEIPEIKKMLSLGEGEKLYWFTKNIYETEKEDKEKLAEHDNAVKIEKMFIEMGAKIIKQK